MSTRVRLSLAALLLACAAAASAMPPAAHADLVGCRNCTTALQSYGPSAVSAPCCPWSWLSSPAAAPCGSWAASRRRAPRRPPRSAP
jgi:hypothetical protein